MKKSDLLKIIKEEIDIAMTEDVNADKAAKDAQKLAIQKQIQALQKKLAELARGGVMNEVEELDEEQLDEMAKITGRLEAAIKKVIAANPEAEGLALKKLIRKDTEVEDSLEGDTMYDNQLNKFISLQKGERVIGQRGRKADPEKTEKPSTPKPKPAAVSKPVNDLTDDEGNAVEIDTTFKTATGNKELETKLKDVVAKKKAKLATAKGADYDKELAALKQFLAKPEISKYIKKKSVDGVNPYSLDSILNK